MTGNEEKLRRMGEKACGPECRAARWAVEEIDNLRTENTRLRNTLEDKK